MGSKYLWPPIGSVALPPLSKPVLKLCKPTIILRKILINSLRCNSQFHGKTLAVCKSLITVVMPPSWVLHLTSAEYGTAQNVG